MKSLLSSQPQLNLKDSPNYKIKTLRASFAPIENYQPSPSTH